jgi:hypothetical protein
MNVFGFPLPSVEERSIAQDAIWPGTFSNGEFWDKCPFHLRREMGKQVLEGSAQSQLMLHVLRVVARQLCVIRLDCLVALTDLDALTARHSPLSCSLYRSRRSTPSVHQYGSSKAGTQGAELAAG